ncbi:hypothetical protein Dda_0225 [Drechslerella dactyloides]|uniref:Uncharacterized protein n=1 Tax=Drechslerella dactyloides TaxID=74499 RepID=A0AAD6NMI0_DREDA|nr:hypothetical protein Dda_0225 [Drechslerella dactyloides]
MAAALFTQSCTVASSLYATAISSLNTTFPTLLPSSPSASIDLARFSVYSLNISPQQLFSSPLPLALARSLSSINIRISLPPVHAWMPVEIPLEQLTFWQVAHALLFIGTVGILSWMLDSHHSDDDMCTVAAKTMAAVADAVTPASSKKGDEAATTQPSARPKRRRATLETIATLIALEDVRRLSRRRKSCSPLPPSLFLPHYNSSSTSLSSLNITPPSSAPTSPTDVHAQLIPPAEGTSTKLLKREMTRRRKSIGVPEEAIRQHLAEVAEYDAGVVVSAEAAQWRREGSWRTKLLLRLRVPVGWTMK